MPDSSPSQTTVQKLITPHDQFIRTVFNMQRFYFIDIYQREYKWTDEQVKMLLNDLEVRFESGKRLRTAPREIQQDVLEHFDPYFLNTYLTHTSPTATSIVDGQQRLTTILLILIKLCQILQQIDAKSESKGKTIAPDTLRSLIFDKDDFGGAARFKIFNPNREAQLRALVEGTDFTPEDETQKRLKENFAAVSNYFDNFFRADSDPSGFDLAKLTYYIIYLLDRVSIVEIRIERQDNVAMIFEVVNDRGLGLKPYEILKGKFIGNLPVKEKEDANHIWVSLQDLYYRTQLKNTTETSIDLDDFFRIYFRAKFANNENDYKAFESDYHYEIYRRPELRAHFAEFKDHQALFNRIKNEIQYFSKLYQELRTDYSSTRPHLFYNKLLEQNQQYLLIMSAVRLDDPQKDEKIRTISAKFDQLHVILRVLGAYESNTFQRLIYELNSSLRNKTEAECRTLFDDLIIKTLKEEKRLEDAFSGGIADIFTYERFKNARNNSNNFSKYLLMRIDRWLIELLDKPSYCKGPFNEIEERFNKTNRRRYGMHLEHIYAFNDINRALFPDPKTGLFDEAGFEQTRNYLGMVLLLKDLQNISSNNDIYKDKLNDYAKSDIIWNELLAGHLPSVDVKILPGQFQWAHIQADANGAFPKDKVDERQRLFFEAFKTIWSQV
jgi:uncharacterized protein with ParB-like and HNH nuclease domain